ncbi:MAG: A/G-specific adenine glycosylase [Planctomycetota bacterium]|jgi:A/G-specific adenine glycosylase
MSLRPDTEALFEPYNGSTLTRLRRNLRDWYRKHSRDLPWRRTGNPYEIWISEIMLQQTTVAAVVPFFERFLKRFPHVEAVAEAEQGEVLRLWEGLGYYSRARNIHRAAQYVANELSGEFPATVEGLMELPGIGRYTAGAIVSFAYDRPAPIVEANTLRLYSRLLGFDGDPRSSVGQRTLWAFAESLLPSRHPGEFNQSLMELGSQLCMPNEPDCGACPLKSGCRAFAAGRQAEIPVAARKPKITPIVEVAVAIERDGRYLLRRNPDGQRWAGLWDFIRFPLEDAGKLLPDRGLRPQCRLPEKLLTAVRQHVAAECGVEIDEMSFLKEIRHSVTRYRIRLQCLHAERVSPFESGEALHEVRAESLADYPLPVTGRQLAEVIVSRHGSDRNTLF